MYHAVGTQRGGKREITTTQQTTNKMTIYPKLILDALATVRYPGSGKDLVAAGMVGEDIRIDGNRVSFSLIFERENDPFRKSVVKAAETAILTYVGANVGT